MTPKKKAKTYPISRSDRRYKYISDLSIIYEGFGGEVLLHTPDISPRGMFIHTSLDIPQGAVIIVNFRLQRANVKVTTRAEVRYCLPGVGVGVEFVEISPEVKQAIEEELGD